MLPTLVPSRSLGFPALADIKLPAGPNSRPLFDYGPEFDTGVIAKVLPVARAESYGVFVPKVDADGNEVAGVRLPDVAVPTSTLTGWATRTAAAGAAGELCSLDGSTIPFAATKAAREAAKDPRPSLEERYASRAAYVDQVRAATLALERDGFLLAEHVERIVAHARDGGPASLR